MAVKSYFLFYVSVVISLEQQLHVVCQPVRAAFRNKTPMVTAAKGTLQNRQQHKDGLLRIVEDTWVKTSNVTLFFNILFIYYVSICYYDYLLTFKQIFKEIVSNNQIHGNYFCKIEAAPVHKQNYYILLLPVQNPSVSTDFIVFKCFIPLSPLSQFCLSDTGG